MDSLPAFYDDLAACRAALWRCLADGASGRRSGFHTPALATVDEKGRPRVRTVVLRDAVEDDASLRFHCDRRSDKAAEIAATGRAALLAYDADAKIQIRIEGTAALHADDALADTAWAGAQAMSRVCYGVTPGPGTPLAEGGAYALPDRDETAAIGRENFCAVLVRAERLDFLYLDQRGHRRALWRRGTSGWTGEWVAP